MTISAFDLFKVGIGPSSSHTVGPMRAPAPSRAPVRRGPLGPVARVARELFGSLGATGHGHGSDKAVLLGLEGERPDHRRPGGGRARVESIAARASSRCSAGTRSPFERRRRRLPGAKPALPPQRHALPGASTPTGRGRRDAVLLGRAAASSSTRTTPATAAIVEPAHPGPLSVPHRRGAAGPDARDGAADQRRDAGQRARLAHRGGGPRGPAAHLVGDAGLRGARLPAEGVLPGGLKVRRRARRCRAAAPERHPRRRRSARGDGLGDPVRARRQRGERRRAAAWSPRRPTAPPASCRPCCTTTATSSPGADDDGVVRFLLTAGAIGVLYKENASISGAEVGCQGEVGSACSMAAAGLAEVIGGTPAQVENAAEIAMEHNLGLTCDPVGGLVQIPCIERNAIGVGEGDQRGAHGPARRRPHHVSLDKVIKTMRETGADMKDEVQGDRPRAGASNRGRDEEVLSSPYFLPFATAKGRRGSWKPFSSFLFEHGCESSSTTVHTPSAASCSCGPHSSARRTPTPTACPRHSGRWRASSA